MPVWHNLVETCMTFSRDVLAGKKSAEKQSCVLKNLSGPSILAFCFVLHILWACLGHPYLQSLPTLWYVTAIMLWHTHTDRQNSYHNSSTCTEAKYNFRLCVSGCMHNLILSYLHTYSHIPYSGKFLYGANFRISRMCPLCAKTKTTKVWMFEIFATLKTMHVPWSALQLLPVFSKSLIEQPTQRSAGISTNG